MPGSGRRWSVDCALLPAPLHAFVCDDQDLVHMAVSLDIRASICSAAAPAETISLLQDKGSLQASYSEM